MTNLQSASLLGSTLERATFNGADLTLTNFSHAQLNEVLIAAEVLVDTNFTGADIQGAQIISQRLVGVIFTDADLTRSMVFGVHDGVIFLNTTCPDGTNSDTNNGSCHGHDR